VVRPIFLPRILKVRADPFLNVRMLRGNTTTKSLTAPQNLVLLLIYFGNATLARCEWAWLCCTAARTIGCAAEYSLNPLRRHE
jgi:hypothetical protein